MNKKHIFRGILPLIIAVAAGIMAVAGIPMRVENMVEDAFYQNPGVIPEDIKIIGIDEGTLCELGPYSDWDRGYFAQIIELLNHNPETAPKVIGIDIVFSGTNNSKEDAELVSVCKKYGNVVLASSLEFDEYLCKDSDDIYHTVQYVSGESKPYDELAKVVDYGFTNAIYDDDGIVRKMHTVYRSLYEGETVVYDSFARIIASKVGKAGEYDSQAEIAFVGNPGEFEMIPMSEVLNGNVEDGYFKECVVLIGAYEEGMMDSYRVPINYSSQMYGVELEANYINALLNAGIIIPAKAYVQFLVTAIIVCGFGFWAFNKEIRQSLVGAAVIILVYLPAVKCIFVLTQQKLNILAVPIGVIAVFLIALIYKYVEMQKARVYEMRDMLFSMAEAMAEAIEGRTPYNANHTQNVAERSLEMLEFINRKYKEKKTELHFSEQDKNELYLAAMLHDVGKMDIPLEVMDKPTKLGNGEKELRNRLEIIRLHIENDTLKGIMLSEDAQERIKEINLFLEKLDGFNCGRPLKDDEWELVNRIAESVYVGTDGKMISYMTQEENDNIHITSGTLSAKEREIMQSHVVYTDKILSHIRFGDYFKRVRRMASEHHELLNGKGYPKGISGEKIDVMTRILTIMDIYDSLIADDRPYKRPKSVKVAFEILDDEAKAGKIDGRLLEFAKELYLTAGQQSD